MKRQILIRFDDICPTMNHEQFERALKILNKYNIKPLLGVIPDCNDKDLFIDNPNKNFWKYMKDLESIGYTLAMHGYKHEFDINIRGKVNCGYHSEFAGHSYSVQFEKISKGKEILREHDINTNIFFAPAHSYDDNTLRALAENGFKYISDGRSNKPFLIHDIISIPCRAAGVPHIGRYGYYTCVFHAHEWVRPDKAYGFEQLVDVCEAFHDDIVDFKEYCNRELGNPKYQGGIEYLETKVTRLNYAIYNKKKLIKVLLKKLRS